MRSKVKAVIGIGSNLPSPFGCFRQTLLESIRRIKHLPSLQILAQSPLYRSEAWPVGGGQPDYVNMAVLVEVKMSAQELLIALQKIESDMGRVRAERWAARAIDLDLLAFGESISPTVALWHSVEASEDQTAYLEDVTVPHPRLHKRLFAIIPFSDIYPEWQHPILLQTAKEIAERISQGKKHPLELYED